MRTKHAHAWALIGLALALGAHSARAADQPMIDAAKQEGAVTWYTTLIIDQFARPAADAFEKKYGVKVEYVRANSNEVALRMVNESKAGKVLADVVDGTSISLALNKEKLLMKWTPESASRFDRQFIDPEGYWVATNQYVLTPGVNTNLVPKGSEPKTFDDLLDPKWKGKMAWATIPVPSSAGGFIGLTIKRLGDEKGLAYLKELAKQNIVDVGFAAGRPLLDQVIAGEYPIALQIFNNHAVISAQQGAPSAWLPMQPVMSNYSVLSVTQGGPHPNAGKLLVDFLVSEEGMKIYQAADYIAIDPKAPPRDPLLRPDGDKLKAIYFTPEEIELAMPKWVQTYKDLFN